MKLIAAFVFVLMLPATGWANGSPCGYPPEIADARAARAIGQAARADLTATQVDQSFIERARTNITTLVERFGLSRDWVVELYVFHVCKELAAQDTLPGTLSKAIARLQEGLARDVAEAEAGREAEPKSAAGSPGAAAPETTTGAPAGEVGKAEPLAPADERAATEESVAAGSGADQTGAAVEPVQRPAPSPAPAPPGQPSGEAPAKIAAEQAAKIKHRAYRRAPEAKQDNRVGQEYAAPKGYALPKGDGVTSYAFRPPASASPESGQAARPAAPAPQAAPAQPAPNAAIRAPHSAEGAAPTAGPAPETALRRGPASEESQPETAAIPPAAESAPGGGDEPDTAREPDPARQLAEAAQAEPEPEPEAVNEAAPEAQPEAAAQPRDEAGAPAEYEAETSQPDDAAQPEAQVAAGADADGHCPERGVLGPDCFDVDEALERLRERPVEYNHPRQMTKGQATEISLVLRTDFEGEGLPEDVSEAFEGLQGEVRQQRAKIANIMSARLRGRDFEIDPAGMQERTVTWRRPVEWSWYVTPKASGEDKRLQLELFAHIVNPQGEMQPPVLIKTLDATIDVDVRTFDWLIEQARTFEPIYGIAAAIIGLLTALLTLWLRRRPAHSSGEGGPPSGITATQAPAERRISDMSASEAAAAAARKGEDQNGSG